MAWILTVGLIVIIIVVALPSVMKAVLNRALLKMDGYNGRIDQLQIHAVKSELIFYNVCINTDSRQRSHALFLQVPAITIGFKWKQLLRKILDLNIVIEKPEVSFLANATMSSEDDPSNLAYKVSTIKAFIERQMAFRINLEVRSGEVRYVNSQVNPKMDIVTTKLNATIGDFSNRTFLSPSCHIIGNCFLYEGTATINATILPMEPTLTADVNLELKSINLILLNDYLRAYAKVDINKGMFDLYAEMAAINNSFTGYLTPILRDIHFISAEDRSDNIFLKIWERMVAGFYNILKNKRNAEVVAKIPIEGRLDDPHIHVGVAIITMLKNAFVGAQMTS
jgi:hypothetical protein